MMAHHPKSQRQETQDRCTICALFQSMGRGQYRSSYDREMYIHHLQTAHGVKFSERGPASPQRGDVLRE